jgi:hypothetical protein
MPTQLCAWLLYFLMSILPLFGWQDDVTVNLRNPFSHFSRTSGFGFLQKATTEVRLGRYLSGSENHIWRGAVEGDVALIQFSDRVLWQFGLNMETLADDLNDINFRLVQVYYQALTGVKIKLGSGLLHIGIRHRCNHGTDQATTSRVVIRLGLTGTYQWIIPVGSLQFDILPGVNVYLVGQNRDHSSQALGGAFFSSAATWPIRPPVFMRLSAGTHFELVGSGTKTVYLITNKLSSLHIEPLFGGKISLRIDVDAVLADIGIHFAQNLDSGISDRATKVSVLSFDVDFLW